MCRIFGHFGGALSPHELRVASLLQRHGGPDAQSIVRGETWALGNDRLAIVDIDGGRQPFSHDGSVQVVFNGEIYNHAELRRELQGHGYSFADHCDGSIIPALYVKYGPDFVRRLEGMYAIAIVDLREEPLLLLYSDHAGMKSLYYHWDESRGHVYFASEIPALLSWNFPGLYRPGAPRVGSKHGPSSRDVGMTAWGSAFAHKLKYYVGVYGIDSATPKAYYSGRLSYSFQGSEPGYYGPSTYYGKQRLVTLAVSAQYQRKGSFETSVDPPSAGRRDTLLSMADVLIEQPVAEVGTFTLEAQGYKFNNGYAFGSTTLPEGGMEPLFAPREAFYLLLSYLTPRPVGVGKLQPLVRWQQTGRPAWRIIDAALAYVIKESRARVVMTARRIDRGDDGGVTNSIQLGVQLQSP